MNPCSTQLTQAGGDTQAIEKSTNEVVTLQPRLLLSVFGANMQLQHANNSTLAADEDLMSDACAPGEGGERHRQKQL